jgi:hypothetical protein
MSLVFQGAGSARISQALWQNSHHPLGITLVAEHQQKVVGKANHGAAIPSAGVVFAR